MLRENRGGNPMRVLINIDVPNLTSGIDFYTRAFGLRHTRTLENDVAELQGTATTIYLLEKTTASPVSLDANAKRNYARHWTPVHLDFVVEDINDAKPPLQIKWHNDSYVKIPIWK